MTGGVLPCVMPAAVATFETKARRRRAAGIAVSCLRPRLPSACVSVCRVFVFCQVNFGDFFGNCVLGEEAPESHIFLAFLAATILMEELA